MVDRSGPVTTSEQQAVPVAQEVTASLWLERAEHCNMILPSPGSPMFAAVAEEMEEYAECKLAHFIASLPCKSGEGADYGEGVGSVCITPEIDAALHRALLASTTPVSDATQTREAEGEAVAILSGAVRRILARCEAVEDENSDQLGKDQTEASSGFLRGERFLAKSIRRELHDLTRSALNARGGA